MVPREKASFVFPETQTLRFYWGLRETMKIASTYETSVGNENNVMLGDWGSVSLLDSPDRATL